jgi:hypothetical protein
VSRAKLIENRTTVPVPEWEELARAAWPGWVPSRLAEWFGAANSTLFLLGLVGQLIAAWAHAPWLALAVWVVPAMSDWLSTRADVATSRMLDRIGLRPQARALLRSVLFTGAILASGLPNAMNAGLAYLTVVAAVQLAWFVQPALAIWVARVAPPMPYQPGAAIQLPLVRRYAAVYARAVGTPAALFGIELVAVVDAVVSGHTATASILTLLGLTVAGAAVETALIYLGWTGWQAHTARRDAEELAKKLHDKLVEAAPSFVIYLGGARQPEEVANQWLPRFADGQAAGIVVVRQASRLTGLIATRYPVIYAPTEKDLRGLASLAATTAFYVDWAEQNAALLRDSRLRHVMLVPGYCDQTTSVNNLVRGFDEVWVPGEAAIDRYAAAGIPTDNFVSIGRPQCGGNDRDHSDQETPVVLYAPTWEGEPGEPSYTSLDRMGVRLIRRLLRTYPQVELWFRPDPASGTHRVTMLTAATEIATILRTETAGHRVVGVGGPDLAECFERADVLISDVSVLATDFLATGRPVITCISTNLPAPAFVERYPSQAASYLVDAKLESLAEAMEQALGADPLADARAKMQARVFLAVDSTQLVKNLSRLCSPEPVDVEKPAAG